MAPALAGNTNVVEIASSFEATRQRLTALNADDPVTKALVDQARTELEHGHTNAASALLERAEKADLAATARWCAVASLLLRS
jgi:hypothetical protein